MKKPVSVIKEMAKSQLRGNWGQALLATIVPTILLEAFMVIPTTIFGNNFYLLTGTTMFLQPIITFMILTMVFRLARGYQSANFAESLSPSHKLLRIILYSVILSVFALIAMIPANYFVFGSVIVDNQVMYDAMQTFDPTDSVELFTLLLKYIGLSVVTTLLISIITIPLWFTNYIIVDEDLSVLESVKLSLHYTKTNFFRIIYLQLSFLGWYILTVFTFGLLMFYVVPYQTMTFMKFYIEVKREHGKEVTLAYSPQPTTTEYEMEEVQKPSNNWDF